MGKADLEGRVGEPAGVWGDSAHARQKILGSRGGPLGRGTTGFSSQGCIGGTVGVQWGFNGSPVGAQALAIRDSGQEVTQGYPAGQASSQFRPAVTLGQLSLQARGLSSLRGRYRPESYGCKQHSATNTSGQIISRPGML